MHPHGVERIVLSFFAPVTVLAAIVVGVLAGAVAYGEDRTAALAVAGEQLLGCTTVDGAGVGDRRR